jgi:hypothetical protein
VDSERFGISFLNLNFINTVTEITMIYPTNLSRCSTELIGSVADPDPDLIRSVDPDPDSESGSGSKRAKITHKNIKKPRNFMF